MHLRVLAKLLLEDAKGAGAAHIVREQLVHTRPHLHPQQRCTEGCQRLIDQQWFMATAAAVASLAPDQLALQHTKLQRAARQGPEAAAIPAAAGRPLRTLSPGTTEGLSECLARIFSVMVMAFLTCKRTAVGAAAQCAGAGPGAAAASWRRRPGPAPTLHPCQRRSQPASPHPCDLQLAGRRGCKLPTAWETHAASAAGRAAGGGRRCNARHAQLAAAAARGCPQAAALLLEGGRHVCSTTRPATPLIKCRTATGDSGTGCKPPAQKPSSSWARRQPGGGAREQPGGHITFSWFVWPHATYCSCHKHRNTVSSQIQQVVRPAVQLAEAVWLLPPTSLPYAELHYPASYFIYITKSAAS